MLTIITGEPGNGKTSYLVELLRTDPLLKDRPLFVWGIPDLKLAHTQCPPLPEWTTVEPHPDDPTLMLPTFAFPDGSVIVVDECQDVYRPRSAASKVPGYVSALERHRHKGLDFYLLTQKPQLIDSNVRNLCGRHIHIRASWAGRKLLEWSQCRNPDSRADRAEAITRGYKVPAKSFELYKSASVHTKPQHRKPWQLAAVALLVVVVGSGTTWVGYRLKDKSTAPESVEAAASGETVTELARAPALSPMPPAAPAPVPPAESYKLVARTYVAVGGQVLHDRYAARASDGSLHSIEGERCAGDRRHTSCTHRGALVTW